MENFKKWLGKKVSVQIDRQFGTKHPEYPDLIYKLNYGYIPGTISEYDGEEIDAYVMGVDKALTNFKGKVIAVVKRSSGDQEFKLIVAKKDYNIEEINKAIDFQERFFEHEIIHL